MEITQQSTLYFVVIATSMMYGEVKNTELSRNGSFGEKHFVFSYVFIQDLCRCKFIHQPTLVSFLQCACERGSLCWASTQKKDCWGRLRVTDKFTVKFIILLTRQRRGCFAFFPFFSLCFFCCCCCLPLYTHISSHSHAARLMGRRQRYTDDDEEEDTRRIQFSFHHISFCFRTTKR